jgi:hypothetical protein
MTITLRQLLLVIVLIWTLAVLTLLAGRNMDNIPYLERPEMASKTFFVNEAGSMQNVEMGRRGPVVADSVELRYGQDRIWKPPKDYRENGQ